MFHLKIVVALILGKGLSSHTQFSGGPAKSLKWESCNYGDVVQNTCNICTCTSKGVYNCEPRDCDKTTQALNSTKECQPNKVYFRQDTYCMCRKEGHWPHQFCHKLFRELPEKAIKKKTCEPEGYVRIDCNICRCSAQGDVDTTRCTINECEVPKHRRSNAESSMFGSCIVHNWYSMGPCQLCICVGTNKLICSTGVRPSNLNSGQNSLTWCGPEFLKQAAALIPSNTVQTISHIIYRPPVNMAKNPFDLLQSIKKQKQDTIPKQKQKQDITTTTPKIVVIDFDANLDTARATIPPHIAFKYPLNTLKNLMMARKTLTIDPGAYCVPGTVTSIKCNICHCLTNGKMICSNHKC